MRYLLSAITLLLVTACASINVAQTPLPVVTHKDLQAASD